MVNDGHDEICIVMVMVMNVSVCDGDVMVLPVQPLPLLFVL